MQTQSIMNITDLKPLFISQTTYDVLSAHMVSSRQTDIMVLREHHSEIQCFEEGWHPTEKRRVHTPRK